MQRLFVAAILAGCVITSVQAEEMFYIVYDKTMRGCTIVTTEPSDKTRYKTERIYKTEVKLRKQSPRSMNAEIFGRSLHETKRTKPGSLIAPRKPSANDSRLTLHGTTMVISEAA